MTTIQALEGEARRMLEELEALSQTIDDVRTEDRAPMRRGADQFGKRNADAMAGSGEVGVAFSSRQHAADDGEAEQYGVDAEHAESAFCPIMWLLPEFIDLVAQDPARPVSEFEHTIRQRVCEQLFIDETGDPPLEQEFGRGTDHQVRTLVVVLEKVRRHALARGIWCEQPAAQPMFG